MINTKTNHRPPKKRTINFLDLDHSFYTLYEVADLLGFHYQTIRRMIKSGELPAKKLGRSWRVRVEDLQKFTTPDR